MRRLGKEEGRHPVLGRECWDRASGRDRGWQAPDLPPGRGGSVGQLGRARREGGAGVRATQALEAKATREGRAARAGQAVTAAPGRGPRRANSTCSSWSITRSRCSRNRGYSRRPSPRSSSGSSIRTAFTGTRRPCRRRTGPARRTAFGRSLPCVTCTSASSRARSARTAEKCACRSRAIQLRVIRTIERAFLARCGAGSRRGTVRDFSSGIPMRLRCRRARRASQRSPRRSRR